MSSTNGAGKTESETSKVFIRRKKSKYGQTHRWAQRISPSWWFYYNHFYGHFFQVLLQPIILLCLVLSLYLASLYFRALPCVPTHLLAKMDSSEGAYG